MKRTAPAVALAGGPARAQTTVPRAADGPDRILPNHVAFIGGALEQRERLHRPYSFGASSSLWGATGG